MSPSNPVNNDSAANASRTTETEMMKKTAKDINRELRIKLTSHMIAQPIHSMPMKFHMDTLRRLLANPMIAAAYEEAIKEVDPITESGIDNPWQYVSIKNFIEYFNAWFTDLPRPDNCLGNILPFSWFYKNNKSATFFLNEFKSKAITKDYTKEIYDWMYRFILIRGEFMNSEPSIPPRVYEEYAACKHVNMEDFLVPVEGFISFNEFFTRRLDLTKNPRPIAKRNDDSIVISPVDANINFVHTNLSLDTNIDVKGSQISMNRLLDNSKHASNFIGGTAISCVLSPIGYHHFHSPVNGKIIESKDIPGIYTGQGIDAEHWFNDISTPDDSNIDFSVFERFHRSYYIIDTNDYGYVALIPVGLNTVSKIQPTLIGNVIYYVPPNGNPVDIRKGDVIGNFAFGGSLNILLFEKGVMPSISLQMGNRLGQMYAKKKEEKNNADDQQNINDNEEEEEEEEDFDIRPACVQRD